MATARRAAAPRPPPNFADIMGHPRLLLRRRGGGGGRCVSEPSLLVVVLPPDDEVREAARAEDARRAAESTATAMVGIVIGLRTLGRGLFSCQAL